MMANESYAALRVGRSVERDFPALPTLHESIPCDGLAFVQQGNAPIPVLRPLRDRIAEIRRGPFDGGAGTDVLIVTTFARPTHIDSMAWPTALRLVASQSGALRSFAQAADPHPDVPHPPGRLYRVELRWNGRFHRIALEALTPVPIAALWDMPAITLYEPTPRHIRNAGRRSSRSAVPLHNGKQARARVSHAHVPLESGADPIADIAARLRDLEERTKLTSIFRQIRDRIRGRDGADTGPDRGPGILANLVGWVRWHTPLGNALKRQLGARMNQVEKLIAAGDLDSALKLALRLSGDKPGETPSARYPNRLPGIRGTLDFDFRRSRYAAPILGGTLFMNVRTRYQNLAERLERERDFRRAAYIRSQLLDDHRGAALVLERGELYAEAARLALGAKLEPQLTIRLLYKAGEHDAALALAKRTACFEQLAEDSRDKDRAFHAYVIKAWTDMLVATGQMLRAVQVSDALANVDGMEALLALRRRWLAAAIADAASDGLDGELTARALLTSSWSADPADVRSADDLPYRPLAPEDAFAPAITRWEAMMRGETEDAGDWLVELLGSMMRIGDRDSAEQAEFWDGPGPALIERYARGLIEIASNQLDLADLQSLEGLLRRACLPVLAADIRKLRKLHVGGPPPRREWHVPAPAVIRPSIRAACLIEGGAMLIWRESKQLELLDRHGTPLWRQGVSDVIALVPVGTSPNVLIVQQQSDGACMLTRFASQKRSFHPIGAINLIACHDVTSESQWLVQIDGEIGALDLAKLCAPVPSIEFLWCCALTDQLRVRAFAHLPTGPSWLTTDISPNRAGILESWTLRPSGELTTDICLSAQPSDPDTHREPLEWFWDAVGKGRLGTTTSDPRQWMSITPWSEEVESRARMAAARQTKEGSAAGADRFLSCDFGRPFVRASGSKEAVSADRWMTSICRSNSDAPIMTLTHKADLLLTCLARSLPKAAHGKTTQSGGTLLLADDHGRLFVVRTDSPRVTVF
jgi:hypothetical protein